MTRHNPFKLFDFYTEADSRVFFGREREVSAVVGDILANKLLVLFARSGSGKTSLLNAGIGPALREVAPVSQEDPGLLMVTVRLSGKETPDQSALEALRATLGTAGPNADETLHDFLRRRCTLPGPIGPGKAADLERAPLGLVLVFDQFEEFFISLFRDRPDDRREFCNKLARIIHDQTLRAYVVLSLRSDHFHQLNEFRSAIPSIFQNNTNLELRPFDRDTALRVIRGPAEREGSGFSWENGLPERIVADLEALNDDKDGVLPIHLQIVCYGLWDSLKSTEHVISAAHYDEFVAGTNRSPAEEMIRRRVTVPLEAVQGRTRQRWLYRLLRMLMTHHGTKVPRALSQLRETIPQKHLNPLLSHLEQELLLRPLDAESETWYELRHDYLVRTITPWLDVHEDRLKSGDRLRLALGIGAVVLVTALATMLLRDWNTYVARLGENHRPDELLLQRRPALGHYSPAWWQREIATGFVRSELLAAGLKRHRFPVERALSDWKPIGEQLELQQRWELLLATQLRSHASNDFTDATLFEAAEHDDIVLLARADDSVCQFLVNTLKSGGVGPKSSAAFALGILGAELTPERRSVVVNNLLEAITQENPRVKRSATRAIASLGEILPEESALDAIVKALTIASNDENSDVRRSAVSALGHLAEKRPQECMSTAVVILLKALKDPVDEVRASAASALVSLGDKLPPESRSAVVDAVLIMVTHYRWRTIIAQGGNSGTPLDSLGGEFSQQICSAVDTMLIAFKSRDSYEKSTAARGLGRFRGRLPTERRSVVVNALLVAIKDQDSDVRDSAVDALGSLAETLPDNKLSEVVKALLLATIDGDSDVSRNAGDALEIVVEILPDDNLAEVVDALLIAIGDQEFVVQEMASDALGSRQKGIPPKLLFRVVDALLVALKDPDDKVRAGAANALHTLGGKLPQKSLPLVVDALLIAMNDPDSSVRSEATSAVDNLGEIHLQKRFSDVVDALFVAMKDKDSHVKRSAAYALSNLSKQLLEQRRSDVVDALLAAIKDENSFIKSNALEALLDMSIPDPRRSDVVDALLVAAKDDDHNVCSRAIMALDDLRKELPRERLSAIVDTLIVLTQHEDEDFVARPAGTALRNIGELLASAPSMEGTAAHVFLVLDPLTTTLRRPALSMRTLASAPWPQSNQQLIAWLEHDDGRRRVFALQVLARRQALPDETIAQIRLLRNDPKNRPWVKLAALRCLMEVEREKEARKTDEVSWPNSE